MVVDHHDIGLGGPTASPEQEATIEVRALETSTEVGFGAHLVPHLGAGGHRQIAQGTVCGMSRPFRNPDKLVELVLLQQRALRGYRLVHARQAEIVPPTLE